MNTVVNKVTLTKLMTSFVEYTNSLIQIKNQQNLSIRSTNFPDYISENIVKFIIEKHNGKICNWKTSLGDLSFKEERYQVKCFSSNGPISFGPKTKWDEIYFLDMRNFLLDIIICYKCVLPSDSEIWKNIKINKLENMKTQQLDKRRPRINFDTLYKQIPSIFITEIYNGKFLDIFREKSDEIHMFFKFQNDDSNCYIKLQ